MQKQIHVNSYVKRDGTQVKEHFRNIDTDNYGTPPIVPENPNWPVLDEQNHNPLKDLCPNTFNPTMNMDSGPVLQGGVSVDVGIPTGGSIGDVLGSIGGVLGTVVAVGAELAPIVLQMYQAMNSGNSQAVDYLKPQFDTKIKQLDTQVAQMKSNIDNNITKLVNAKNRTEYSKIYEPLQKDWQEYQHAQDIVNRIKVHANNGDFKSVANELRNFTNRDLIQNWDKNGKIFYTNKAGQPVNIKIPTNEYLKNHIKASAFNTKNFINDLSSPYKMNLEDYTINGIGKLLSMKAMPVAGANLDNAINDFAYAKSSGHVHIINSRVQITNQGLNKLMDNVRIPKDSRGVIYDNNSEQSQILWQSPEMQNFVRNNLQDLISDNANGVYDIEFKLNGNYTGHRWDNYLGLQHCKLYNPQITPDGYFKGIIVDYYDFVKRIINSLGSYLNYWGYSMQEKGLLENIFNIYIIYEKL